MKFDSQIIRHARWEMTLMRIAFAADGLAKRSLLLLSNHTALTRMASLISLNLSFLMNPEILGILRGVLAVALLFYASGIVRVSFP